MAPLQRLWAAACWLPVLWWARESTGASLSQLDTLVGAPQLLLLREGTKAAEQGYMTWWL